MQLETIKSLYLNHKESRLSHRYITNNQIKPILDSLSSQLKFESIGKSVLNDDIYAFKIGSGDKRILMWSQMHGNESTTTKAIFDLTNTLLSNDSSIQHILNGCTLYIIPILNPDGAKAYTRINANEVDLNRDAQNLTQPESLVLKAAFEAFKPHYCYNLHGQRTIFSAGNTNKSATVSFLSPAQDQECTITPNRKIAMEIISVMNDALQKEIPGQVGVYDDAFNLNCVGDTFQTKNIPTILFEAGHFHEDYGREKTRKLIYISYLTSFDYIVNNNVLGDNYEGYLNIPENEKLFLDVIIRDASVGDIGIMFQERLVNNEVVFVPKVDKIEDLKGFYAHKTIQANGLEVLNEQGNAVNLGDENVFVIINNEKISLFSK
ncbi:M14 family zinc carboxypeptidase [Aestuariibaculum sp. YM273]|uniref:M14 family zinc carboxypeptidase n=1 Tax=Aestuariibaculum sp. YM273 TaxID=3070659 RepID=UPI0027DD5E2A|nr:M14 family zinc carboxypeptidase [Aestuariibaculum sp. YM273]WMI65148.1 M14 family zinc carboxypeptidase [Aestuariibaculum sp. YM273]